MNRTHTFYGEDQILIDLDTHAAMIRTRYEISQLPTYRRPIRQRLRIFRKTESMYAQGQA